MKQNERDPIEEIRTIFWYEGLRKRLRANTAYAVEKIIEPEGFGKTAHKETLHRNKWSRYARGQHTPQAATVRRAEAKVRGSTRDLNLPLWEVLRVMPQADMFDSLRQVDPALQQIIFERNEYVRVDPTKTFLRKLEHRASLDSLACIIAIFQFNFEQGEYERLQPLAEAIYRMLLIHWVDLDERNVATRLMDLIDARIFSRASYFGTKFSHEIFRYPVNGTILHKVFEHNNQSQGGRGTWAEWVKYTRTIMDGSYGFNWMWMLRPIRVADLDIGPPCHRLLAEGQRDIRLRRWAREAVLTGRPKNELPPPSVFFAEDDPRLQAAEAANDIDTDG